MNGQIELFKKPLIYSKSLSCYKTICPYCKYDNPDRDGNVCPNCFKEFDAENVKVIKSKDFAECETLGLKGAVAKDNKGKWYEVKK